MKKELYSYSESLVITLCEEIEFIKNRSRNIHYSLKSCQNKILSNRLKIELNSLNTNRSKILNISQKLFNRNCKDLSLQFLLEISRRSASIKQT